MLESRNCLRLWHEVRGTTGRVMINQRAPEVKSSPFDPFLSSLLARIADLPNGFSLTSERSRLAETLGWPGPFVDAVFTSAKARGLVEPHRSTRARGRSRWRLSAKGTAWLAGQGEPDHDPA